MFGTSEPVLAGGSARSGIAARLNVRVAGNPEGQPLLFAHGFGCDQSMWRHVWPAFADEYRIVLFDHVGMGAADSSGFDPARYATLEGYARDVVAICRDLQLSDMVFIGHSVSAMIGILAAAETPELFSRLVLICPSPRYVNDGDYVGGFDQTDIEELLESMDGNIRPWADNLAPMIMGNPEHPELSAELADSFCRADPEIARHFARVTFLSDNRADLVRCAVPALVVQCARDVIAPRTVGDYVHSRLPNSTSVVIDASGHCPNLSAPDRTTEAVRRFLIP